MLKNKSDVKSSINNVKIALQREIAKLEKQVSRQGELHHGKRNSLWLRQIADSLSAVSRTGELVPYSNRCSIKNIHTGERETISMNPKLSIEKNAALYEKKAKKTSMDESANNHKYSELTKKIHRLQYALEQVTHLSTETPDETAFAIINKIKQEYLVHLKKPETVCAMPENTCPPTLPLPFRHFQMNEWHIYAGKTDEQNDELSIRFANHSDYWFHVAGHAGSHVIIQRPQGSPIPDMNVLETASAIAAWFSKARNAPFVEVHYTEGRFVHKRKNAPPGEVVLEKFKSIKVKPEPPELLFKNQKRCSN